MAGPFGLGYGLGAAGAGAAEGVVRSQMMAPQIQGLNLQNQQRQMQITNEQAQQSAFSQSGPDVPEGSDPYAQPLSDLKTQYQALKSSGQGMEAHKVQQQLVDLGMKQRTYNMGSGIQSMFVGDYDKATDQMNKAGLPTAKIERDADGNFLVYHTADSDPVKMDPKHLQALLANPDQMGQVLGQQAQQEQMMRLLGLRGEQKSDQIAQKAKADMERLQATLNTRTQIADKGNALKAQIAANAQAGLSNRQQASFTQRPNLDAIVYSHLVNNGTDPQDAYETIQTMKADPKAGLPAFTKTIQTATINNGGKWTPQMEADVTAEYQRLKGKSVPKGLGPKVPVPAPNPGTPQTPAGTSAVSSFLTQ